MRISHKILYLKLDLISIHTKLRITLHIFKSVVDGQYPHSFNSPNRLSAHSSLRFSQ
uniref:Uncharacterized protein n=1 Tax=Rhizophora mucronata TaxID=61149 RepID=A0A2P2Q0T5_RHIMU